MRKQMFYSTRGLFLSLALLFLISCDQLEDIFPAGKDKATTHYGVPVKVGEGTASAWVKTNSNGKPVAIGMKVSAAAMASLTNMQNDGFFLTLPKQVEVPPYKTLTLDWNEMGHEPMGVYTFPHFDFHFYMKTKNEIMDVAGGPDEGAYILQSKGVLPATYIFGPEPIAVPHMGVHWVDVTSPEYTPAGFSKTFVYGSNQDKITFLEPMVTVEYLLSLGANETVKKVIPSLLRFETAGYYPTSYSIAYDAHDNAYTIALTDMVWRNAQ